MDLEACLENLKAVLGPGVCFYVVAGLSTRESGCVYNSAVLLDRQGRIAPRWRPCFHDDDWLTLASLAPDLAVEDIMREFGLTPLGYHVRATKATDDARVGPFSSAARKEP